MKEFKLLNLSGCNASQTMETSVQNVFSYYKKANFLSIDVSTSKLMSTIRCRTSQGATEMNFH